MIEYEVLDVIREIMNLDQTCCYLGSAMF
jgi:hypothetical protein